MDFMIIGALVIGGNGYLIGNSGKGDLRETIEEQEYKLRNKQSEINSLNSQTRTLEQENTRLKKFEPKPDIQVGVYRSTLAPKSSGLGKMAAAGLAGAAMGAACAAAGSKKKEEDTPRRSTFVDSSRDDTPSYRSCSDSPSYNSCSDSPSSYSGGDSGGGGSSSDW